MKIAELLTYDPTEAKSGNSPVVDFIRFRMEPFIEYSLYTIGMFTIVFGTIISLYTGIKDWQKKVNI